MDRIEQKQKLSASIIWWDVDEESNPSAISVHQRGNTSKNYGEPPWTTIAV